MDNKFFEGYYTLEVDFVMVGDSWDDVSGWWFSDDFFGTGKVWLRPRWRKNGKLASSAIAETLTEEPNYFSS